MIPTCTAQALKEWAAVCAALREGKQVFLLRKGGIHERCGEFSVEHDAFFLYPTWEHQKKQMLRASMRAAIADTLTRPPNGAALRIDTFAEVEEIRQIQNSDALFQIKDEHVWNEAYLQMRVDYKPENPLYLLILRAYRMVQPVDLQELPRYAGCRSWVRLEEELSTNAVEPALSDQAFAKKLRQLQDVR